MFESRSRNVGPGLAALLLSAVLFPAVASANSGLAVKSTYFNVHDALGQVGVETPLRWGFNEGTSGYGYIHIRERALQDPLTHVDEPTLSVIIQTVLGDNSAAVIPNRDGYRVVGRVFSDLWTVVVSERPIPDPSTILGIITVFKVPICDIAFAIDTTGSMSDDLASVRSSVQQIVTALETSCSGFRAAVVAYNDPWARVELGFTSDPDAIIGAVNGLGASGGGDTPEHVYSGLMTAIGLPWRDDASKSIILLGDAPPKDPEPGTGHTQASVVAAANAVGVGEVLEGGGAELLAAGMAAAQRTATAEGVDILPVLIGGDSAARGAFQGLADGTGGQLFTAGGAGDVVDALLDAIGASALPAVLPPSPFFENVEWYSGFSGTMSGLRRVADYRRDRNTCDTDSGFEHVFRFDLSSDVDPAKLRWWALNVNTDQALVALYGQNILGAGQYGDSKTVWLCFDDLGFLPGGVSTVRNHLRLSW